jgi:hypothetical protein
LVASDLPVHILGQTPNMWEIENDPVEATLLDCFASLVQLRRIYTVQQSSFLFGFKLLDVGGRLRILFYERRATVEAGSDKSAATVCSEQRMAEGEIAYRQRSAKTVRILWKVQVTFANEEYAMGGFVRDSERTAGGGGGRLAS